MRFHYSRVHRLYLAPAVGLVFALAITACSSTGSSSISTAATSAPAATTSAATASSSAAAGGAAVAEITANWGAFFKPANPNSKRMTFLENGTEFPSGINAFSASPLAQQVSSKVDSVSVTSSTKANVKYDLTAAGTSVGTGQTGTSVLQNGVWKVGDDVFCGLLKEGASLLNISVPAACNSAS